MLTTLLLLLSFLASTPSSLPPAVRTLGGTRSGVDRAGNLWMWDGAQVTRISPKGERIVRAIPDAITVDADEELGIAALLSSGKSVRLLGWDGKFVDEIAITNEAAMVSWAGPHQIAVAPKETTDRVEVWDTTTHKVVRRLAQTTRVAKTPGASPLHTTLLRYDPKRRELVALDSLTGELFVFAENGALVRHAMASAAPDASLASWLASQDRAARAEGHPFNPAIWNYPSLTLSADGSIWIGEQVKGASVQAAVVDAAGHVRHVAIPAAGCPSLRFEAWQGYFVFYRDPKAPQPACVGVRRQ